MTVHSYWLCVYSEYLNTELCYTHSEVYYSVLFHLLLHMIGMLCVMKWIKLSSGLTRDATCVRNLAAVLD